MRNSDIEQWTLKVISRVEARQLVEDSRAELKAQWPSDPAKAARQIAGHANAARGDLILWLIGVDETRGVTGADYANLANWLPAVQAQFSELLPRTYDLNVPRYDKVVVALVLETDRAPFVVKNPVHGKKEEGPVEFEVPWREGTRTRSATRSDLMLVLSDVRSLRSLLRELEWNAEVSAKEGYGREQFRTNEFDRAMSENSFSVVSPYLRNLIRDAYIAISGVQSYKRSLERSFNNERIKAYSTMMHTWRKGAKPTIEKALAELRQFLGEADA